MEMQTKFIRKCLNIFNLFLTDVYLKEQSAD